jgi:hypothetical protein
MDLESYTPKNLIAGDFPIADGDGTILAGQNLAAGTVVAKDSGNGDKLVAVDSAHGTASINDPYAVLPVAIDASGGDTVAPLYLAGEFNENALVFGGADTIADHKEALRGLSIFTK